MIDHVGSSLLAVIAYILCVVCRFGQLQAVDVAGVPPAVHAREEGNVLRADEAAAYPNR